VSDGTVFFGCRNATIYALDAATGTLKWQQKGDRGWVSVSPAVKEGKVYVATGSDKAFKVLDAKSGAVLYGKPINEGTFSSIAVIGDIAVLATFNGNIFAIDPTHDTKATLLAATTHPPIGIASNFYDDHVAAMMARLSQGVFLSSPVVADNMIFIGNTDGTLIALGK
jgi:outer membrane protein assembly factor BamB